MPPADQRRGRYTFTTGEGFSSNWAVISYPLGTIASIDGALLTDPASGCGPEVVDGVLAAVTYVSRTCAIADGVHSAYSGTVPEESGDPIGVLVYGYYQAGSYAYPAGAGLGG